MKKICLLLVLCSILACEPEQKPESMPEKETFPAMEEKQLTFDESGHFLHTTQQFSPDDQWIVYDTRNEDSQIGQTCCIEMVNATTGKIRRLYQTENQSLFGPGVGGVTFNPQDHQVLFIHGLRNCDEDQPYGFSRRTGVMIKTEAPQQPIFMDARDITPPFTPGALRGGTHAHTWSADGQWITFTYNDYVLGQLAEDSDSGVQDLRMVGVTGPQGPVTVKGADEAENFGGEKFTVIVTKVVENPTPGTDEIDRAYEDGWIGEKGYLKADGSRQERAIAFLGDTRNENGEVLTEVFVVDVPNDLTASSEGNPIQGTETTRPMPPKGTQQRRLTFTQDRKHPGVQGPRHWLRSAPDGSVIYFMMKDNNDIIQIYGVSPIGGDIQQITQNEASITTSFNVSRDGQWLIYGIEEDVFVTNITTQKTQQVSPKATAEMSNLRGVNFSNDGKTIVYNRKVEKGDSSYYQIFLLKPKD